MRRADTVTILDVAFPDGCHLLAVPGLHGLFSHAQITPFCTVFMAMPHQPKDAPISGYLRVSTMEHCHTK
jgi:hypothetical protein